MNELLKSLHHERMYRTSPTEVIYKLGRHEHCVKVMHKPGFAIGSVLWAGGKALAEYLLNPSVSEHFVSGKTVIELGAGVGLPGLAIAQFVVPPPRSVTLTDRSDLTPLLQASVDLIEDESVRKIVQVTELDWKDECVDQWDVCIAADVVYEVSMLSLLARTVCAVTKPSGLFVLAYKPRNEVAEKEFFEQLGCLGFEMIKTLDLGEKITILTFQKRSS
eukprot:TRINITY_DN5384_c0_g1_i1.p1 TRINITY_DN5384_c0_g1~~TRINITY_DN5384_c0_g1_i1.p1  ORF type:complete len:219 (+),score=50.85 TRINITY_DN5384_c0_g1_i1:39-695(+)